MGTWYNDAPSEFHEWMQRKFNTHNQDTIPLEMNTIEELKHAWEEGTAKGKGVLDE